MKGKILYGMSVRGSAGARGSESALPIQILMANNAFTDLVARTNAGEEVAFSQFAGKVCLVVNVARL